MNGASSGRLPRGSAGGCTRDLVHRFYQEQYQLNGGTRTATSPAATRPACRWATTTRPSCRSTSTCTPRARPSTSSPTTSSRRAFGGSFLNHQYLIAARPARRPWRTRRPARSRWTRPGIPATPIRSTSHRAHVVDGAVTQTCDLPTTVAGLACGDWAVNTAAAGIRADRRFARQDPPIDDTTTPMTIGDRMTDAGISWAWYARRLGQRRRQCRRTRIDQRPRPDLRRPEPAPARRRQRRTGATRTARTSRSSSTTNRSTTSPATPRACRTGQPPPG